MRSLIRFEGTRKTIFCGKGEGRVICAKHVHDQRNTAVVTYSSGTLAACDADDPLADGRDKTHGGRVCAIA